MAAGIYHNGTTATAKVGANELSTISWSVSHNISVTEFKNSKTKTIALVEGGWNNFAITIVQDYDFANNPFSAVNLYPGQILTNLICYLHGTANTTDAYSFTSVMVTSAPVQVSIEGKIGYSVNCVPNGGPVTLPGAITVN